MLRTFRWIFLAIFLVLVGVVLKEILRIRETSVSSWVKDHRGDCAVVLTGGPGRVREGFDLLSNHLVKKLVISGVNPQARLREVFPVWPFYGELREEDVILERRSKTTYGNAQQTLPIVETLACRSVILITSSIHGYRALRTFGAIYPKELKIELRSVSAGLNGSDFSDVLLEGIKTAFYSLWAF